MDYGSKYSNQTPPLAPSPPPPPSLLSRPLRAITASDPTLDLCRLRQLRGAEPCAGDSDTNIASLPVIPLAAAMVNKGDDLVHQRATELADLKSLPDDPGKGEQTEDTEATWKCQEATLVRLVLHALQGVGNTLDEIKKLSEVFCSIPADRTVHGVPNWWHRTSSTEGFGKFLKSFSHSGRIFLFLSKFVDRFLYIPMDGNCHEAPRNITCQNRVSEKTGEIRPIYSLVNHAFAVALKNVLNGYICALNTLPTSVKLRRLQNCDDKTGKSLPALGSLTSIVYPEITLVEVYLHTTELRNQIEAVANICCLGDEDVLMQISRGKSLDLVVCTAFDNFPRGANLLTYLYVQLRDAGPVHYNLLKMLFSYSCEPYVALIKEWIYRGRVDDPHNEFILEVDDRKPRSVKSHEFVDELYLPFVKERAGICLPCFLGDMYDPLLRTGQQLQILIPLLELCGCCVGVDYNNRVDSITHGLMGIEDILPCWSSFWRKSLSCLPSLAFSWDEIIKITVKRKAMFTTSLEKLELFFTALGERSCPTKDLVNVNNFGSPFASGHKKDSSLLSLAKLNSPWVTCGQGISEVTAYAGNSNVFSPSDASNYEDDHVQSSETYSLYSSEEGTEFEDDSMISDVTLEYSDFFASSLSRLCGNDITMQGPSKVEKQSFAVPENSQSYEKKDRNCEKDALLEDRKVASFTYSSQTRDLENLGKIESVDENYGIASCWPLGGLLSNPFRIEQKNRRQTHFNLDCNIMATDQIRESWRANDFRFDHIQIPECFLSSGKLKVGYPGSTSLLSTEKYPAWNRSYLYDLSMNPVLTKATWSCLTYGRHQDFVPHRISLSYFNFSVVEDPYKVFLERSVTKDVENWSIDYGISYEDKDSGNDECTLESSQFNETVQSDINLSISTRASSGCTSEKCSSASAGGAKWVGSLSYPTEEVPSDETPLSCSSSSEIPLEVIIDRCLRQEILTQYNYVSSFTIRLLEEGFDLCGHLFALRRYHFMESSDWADLFTVSLWKHKWGISEPLQRVAKVQTLLDQALQKSSCENDPHKQRLYIYSVESENMLLSTTDIGAFNFIRLGYKVDWPLGVVLNPEALKIYSDIFSFLMQVRIALFTLADVWNALKAFRHTPNRNKFCSTNSAKGFSTFMNLRIQVNHFVTMLHQYVQSQLSDVSWCRFFSSLNHQVKDMLDLESMHMAHLSNALHICFLSVETRTISSIITKILQCGLDLRLCISAAEPDADSSGLACLTNFFVQINLSQVLAIKTAFEKNLKDLYMCFLKSPKHGEFGLSRFWSYLNYNSYYSNTISGDAWR